MCPGNPQSITFSLATASMLLPGGGADRQTSITKENRHSLFNHKCDVCSTGQGLGHEPATKTLAERPEPSDVTVVVGRNGYITFPAALAGSATNTDAKRKAANSILARNAQRRPLAPDIYLAMSHDVRWIRRPMD